jgi:hypothetical protein
MGKRIQQKASVLGAIQAAIEIIEELGSEIREVVDNTEGTGLRQTGRIETLDTTAGTLEGMTDEPDVPEVVADLEVSWTEYVSKRITRQERCNNAKSALEEAKSALDGWIDDDKNDPDGEDLEDVEAVRDQLDEWISELETCEFPGQRG